MQPGPIDTDMNPSDGDFAAMEKAGTLGHSGKPEEIAAAVAFLAGPDADFITGATISFRHLVRGRAPVRIASRRVQLAQSHLLIGRLLLAGR